MKFNKRLSEADFVNQIVNHPGSLAVKQVGITKISSSSKTLFIIGNGFDLAHGVPSGYNNFRKFLYPKSELRQVLDNFIDKDDIWGNLEDSLAYLDRESLMDNIDLFLKEFEAEDEDSEDFTYGKFYSAIDWALYPAIIILEDLPYLFKKWVKKLKNPRPKESLINLLNSNAKYITFNYTEFLETVYGIPPENILYIHGNRKNKKENLILGHGYDPEELFENWYKENKSIKRDKSSPTQLAYFDDDEELTNYKNAMQYYAIDIAIGRLEEYYENSKKDTTAVIKKHSKFLETLQEIEQIIVLGHSLSETDYAYFSHLISINKKPKQIQWKISWYCMEDLMRVALFSEYMDIDKKQISLFRL